MSRTVLLSFAIGLAALALAPRSSRADCGSVPFYAPAVSDVRLITPQDDGPQELEFDPLKVTVFEPRQRAIILWNGEEETLLLSTDQRATRRSAVLEVIPMPDKPTISLGKFKSFEVAQSLLIQKSMWATAHPGTRAELIKAPTAAGRITFQNQLGAHSLAVAEVLDASRFTEFVQGYLRENYKTPEAPIRPEFIKIIQSYLDQGFKWFAFDVITLDTTNASREPIQYRFKSDKVFYPLRISSLEGGKTEADLLVFTGADPLRFEGLEKKHFKITPPLDVTAGEVAGMAREWDGFFGIKKTVRMTRWTIGGKSSDLLKDVQVK
jgi:hypothetical protein